MSAPSAVFLAFEKFIILAGKHFPLQEKREFGSYMCDNRRDCMHKKEETFHEKTIINNCSASHLARYDLVLFMFVGRTESHNDS
jgi:hypothetical protein